MNNSEPSPLPNRDANNGRRQQGRDLLLVVGGLMLLGAALGLLLFGGDLFGGQATDRPVVGEVPDFDFSQVPSDGSQLPSRSGTLLKVGDMAPDFSLSDLDGNPVSLSDFRGRPVIINFWATWCAPCRLEMPDLQAVYEERQDEELIILALNQDEDPELVQSFFYDELELSFTPLLDVDNTVATVYGLGQFLPSSVFIDESGTITAIHRGIMSKEQIDDYLARTMDGTS